MTNVNQCSWCLSSDIMLMIKKGPSGKHRCRYMCQNCDERGPWANTKSEAWSRWNSMQTLFDKSTLTAAPEPKGDPRFMELLSEMRALHIAKSAGYAGQDNPDTYANFRESERFGISAFSGVMVRMSDKWSRIINLVNNPSNDQVGEPIADTFKDISAYALIALCLYEEEHGTKD